MTVVAKGRIRWKKTIVCQECKDRLNIGIDDLYADDVEDSDNRLKIYVTCHNCGNAIEVKVSDTIRSLVLKSI